ncbi:MAG: GHMP kinase [Thermoplasmata archaeon]
MSFSRSAFSPGSATLMFVPNKERDVLKKGSRGVAICVEAGMVTKAEASDSMDIRFNGIPIDNSIQEEVARKLGFTGRIFSTSQLPPSSGFGLSAGAALTTSAVILGDNARIGEVYRIAHEIEIERGTGLGDVQSQISGGFHVRIKGGTFPYSVTERILHTQRELIILPFKKKVPTGEIIKSQSNLDEITRNGNRAMASFLRRPTMENAFVLGRKFSEESGLISPKAQTILDDLEGKMASVSLIGESIIALYDEETMDILKKYGDPVRTRISFTGLNLG